MAHEGANEILRNTVFGDSAFSFNALLRIFAIHTGRPSVKVLQAQFKVERVHLNTCESMHFQQQEDTSVLLCITVLNYRKIRRHLY